MNKHTSEVRIGRRWVKSWDSYCVVCSEHMVSLTHNRKYCCEECKKKEVERKKREGGGYDGTKE